MQNTNIGAAHTLAKTILLFFMGVLLTSCETEKISLQTKAKTLVGKPWTYQAIVYFEDGTEVTDALADCSKDNVIEFKADKTILYSNGTHKCNVEADTEQGLWSMDEAEKFLTIDEVPYEIVMISSTNLHLKRDLIGADGPIIARYYYEVK